MLNQIISIDKTQLAMVLPVFSTIRPEFSQEVKVFYTNGKDDNLGKSDLWTDVRPGASAAARDIFVHPAMKAMTAVIAFDLTKRKPPARLGFGFRQELKKYEPGVNEIREEMLKTLVHELQHVVQGWVWAEMWAEMARQAASDGYNQNRYELAAERTAQDWVNGNREKMRMGVYDFLFPPGSLH